MKFKGTQVKDIPKLSFKKKGHKLLITQIIFTFILIGCSAYGVYSFLNTYSFQNPIILRSPLILKHNVIISPTIKVKKQAMNEKPLTPKELLKIKVAKTFGTEYWMAMDYIMKHEANYQLTSVNKDSGACGMVQALPCSKLIKDCPNFNDADCQTTWAINYIKDRYGDPIKAMVHEVAMNWY